MLNDYHVGSVPTSVLALFIISIVLRAILLILESIEKRGILLPPHKTASPEVISGPLNRGAFFWLSTLFLRGYTHILKLEDLYPLDPKMHSQDLYETLKVAWDKIPDKTAPNALFSTWLGAFSGPLMSPVFPKLFQIGFTYAQPFLITAAIDLAARPNGQPYNNNGYGLIGAYFIVYTGIAIAGGQYEWRIYRAAILMRGSVVPLTYRKALRLDTTSSNVNPSAALTLVSTDIETITNGIVQLHETWGSLIEIALSIYLIWRQLGAACAMPLALAIVVMIGSVFLAIPTGRHQASWIQASQNRVTATSKALGSIKWLRVSGLNDMAFTVIRNLRLHELEVSKRFRIFLGISLILAICTPVLGPVLTFSTYAGLAARSDGDFTIAQAFTSLSLIVLLNKPLAGILTALPLIAGGTTSFQRIQDYLNAKEREDKRISPNRGSQKCPSTKIEAVNINPKSAQHLTSGAQSAASEEYELDQGHTAKADSDTSDDKVIAMVRGKFSWAENSDPVINIDKDWEVERQTLTLVLGPVGCGKSTLLKALLGELSTFEGTIRTNCSGIAFCSQNPWLVNETVHQNIVGGSSFDEQWYRAVLKACALEADLQHWPQGDRTVVGSKGVSVSGGQKQRISIARAIFARREFLVLDDVFSGLDSNTEDLVFSNLFGEKGVLRNANTTVVLASSDVRRVPHADRILFLNEMGQLGYLGKPTDLDPKIVGVSGWSDARTMLASRARVAEDVTTVVNPPDVMATAKLQADAARQLGDPEVYKFYARSAGPVSLSIFVASMLGFAFCDSFPNIWLKWWAEAEATAPAQDLGKWIGVYVALGVGAVITCLVGTWQLFIVTINRSGLYFHNILVETVSKAPMSFHTTVDSGVTVNRFSQDLQLIDMELPAAALGTTLALSFGLAQFVIICVSSRYMAVVLPFLLGAFYIIQRFYLRTSRQMRLLDIEMKAPLYSQLIETLTGLATIRAFRWEDGSAAKNVSILDDSQRPAYLLFCLQRWLTFAVDIVIMFLAMILIVLTTTLRREIGAGDIGIALSNIIAFSATMKATITSWVSLEVSLGAIARIRSFSSDVQPEDHIDMYNAPSPKLPEDWPSQGSIEMRDVTASYPSRGRVLNGINLIIKPGERVGICGRTGSGKSSLTMSLLRMIDQDSGSVLIDGVDLATLPREFVRTHLVAIPQEAYVFDGTVRLNMDPLGQAASDEDISRALKEVRLWDVIEARGGLDAVIGDEFSLSQGQSQLLVLARAMLRKGRVLILDEATSRYVIGRPSSSLSPICIMTNMKTNDSLDQETSDIIDEVLRTWFKDWTILAIAHKLDLILDFDKVAVLDAGLLVEFDQPRRLLNSDGSVFKELFELSTQKGPTGAT